MNVTIEVFITHLQADRVRYLRREILLDDPDTAPDIAVRDLVETLFTGSPERRTRYLSHSTSWRYEASGRVLLTYLVCLGAEVPLCADNRWCELHADDFNLAKSDDPAQPAPTSITEEQVLSHAIRHLAFLKLHACDETIDSIVPSDAVPLLARANSTLAGQLHQEAN